MKGTRKLYIGNLGWSGTTIHTIFVDESDDGKSYYGEPYSLCAYNTGRHYRIGRVTHLRKIQATKENVTCKKCLKKLANVKQPA